MLIVLPPSETKAFGGDGAPLNWDNLSELSFPGLHDIRREIARDLMALPIEQAFSVLGVSEKLRPELEANKQLADAPTKPSEFRAEFASRRLGFVRCCRCQRSDPLLPPIRGYKASPSSQRSK